MNGVRLARRRDQLLAHPGVGVPDPTVRARHPPNRYSSTPAKFAFSLQPPTTVADRRPSSPRAVAFIS